MEYLLLLIVVFILLLLSIRYIIKLSYNLAKKYVSNKIITSVLSLVPIILFVIGIYIDPINAIVVDVHLIVLTLIIKLVFVIIKRVTKKGFSEYLVVFIGIIVSTLILVPAYFRAYDVNQTNYSVYTKKDIGEDNFRIIQVSDSHMGTTMNGKEFGKYIEEINELEPDIVVITGDFVDDYTSYADMIEASKTLGKLKTKNGVYFIVGNHDRGYFKSRGYSYSDIKQELVKNNVIVLEDNLTNVTNNIVIIGRDDSSNLDRKSISDLTKDIDKDKYIITLNHQPNDYENEVKAEVDLVLSGHTHGGHLFPLGELGGLLGVNDKIYGMETRNKTTFIVNSGIGGWAIKFRTKSIAEYAVIDVTSEFNRK